MSTNPSYANAWRVVEYVIAQLPTMSPDERMALGPLIQKELEAYQMGESRIVDDRPQQLELDFGDE